MKLYKDPANTVFAYEQDGSQDDIIPADQVAITQAEADALRFPPLTLAQQQDQAWERIKAERDRRTQEGGYPAGGKWFHSDTLSRTQQIGLVLLGTNIPANLQWKTMDGSFIAMTQTLASQVFAAAAAQDQATFAAAETHRVAMDAATDPASYDFSAAWPATFQG